MPSHFATEPCPIVQNTIPGTGPHPWDWPPSQGLATISGTGNGQALSSMEAVSGHGGTIPGVKKIRLARQSLVLVTAGVRSTLRPPVYDSKVHQHDWQGYQGEGQLEFGQTIAAG